MKTIISCRDICKKVINGKQTYDILNNININITEGEFVSIMGASGAGKSSLLYILGLMDKDYSGEILIDSKSISGLNEVQLSEIRRESLGFVFQTFNLIPSLNVIDNILLPVYIRNEKRLKSVQRERAFELLEIIGLEKKENQMVSDLSGGEQQRIAIARALINSPKVILMDEPTGNLDSKNAKNIMVLVKKINKTKKITFLQVTHSLEFASYGNRILHMSDGTIYEEAIVE